MESPRVKAQRPRFSQFHLPWAELLLASAFVTLIFMVFATAWVCEDAYITFRVIDNFMQGYGLRWNIDERVAAYTHPLWLLIQIPLNAVWHDVFHANIFLSITCMTAAVAVALAAINRPPVLAALFFLLPLMLSRSVMDYATSGLESSLCYLLYATFGYLIAKQQEHKYFWLYCSLAVALAMLTRLDSVLLYIPPLVWLARRRKVAVMQLIPGLMLLAAWHGFSLIYYGTLIPNTAYAKLESGLGTGLYLTQGMRYAYYLLIGDTMGTLALLWSFTRLWRKPPDDAAFAPAAVALGILCYSLYVIAVGGDYMAGRFWALPVFAAMWLNASTMLRVVRDDVIFVGLCVMLVAYCIPTMLTNIHEHCRTCITYRTHVIDARKVFHKNSLVITLAPLNLRHEGQYSFAEKGRDVGTKPEPRDGVHIRFIGMIGYYAGPKIHIIDELGLADPLLARLPAKTEQNFFAGHFRRDIPKGYLFALRQGSTERMNPALAEYYKKIKLIASGDLWDRERLQAIVALNLGQYDHWKQEYLDSPDK